MTRRNSQPTPPAATVAAGFASGLIEFAGAKGADRRHLLERADLTTDDFSDPDHRISLNAYVRLLRAAAELCHQPALALEFGAEVSMADLSIVGLICYAAETPADAFAQLNRYARLMIDVPTDGSGERLRLSTENGQTWLVDTRTDPNRCPEISEQTFARIAGSISQPMTEGRRMVREVHFTHSEPGHRAAYDRIFHAPIVFDSHWNAVRLDDAWASYAMPRPNQYTFRVLSERAQSLLESLESSRSVRGQVEQHLMPLLHRGEPRVKTLARQMGISRQTLYRRLKAEGVSFESVLDELRRTLAIAYLDARNRPLAEIAYLLGFSDPTAFSRAFKRWTGTSPRTYRRTG